MKRPASIYLLVIFYGAILLGLLWLLIPGNFGLSVSRLQRDLWEYALQRFNLSLWIYSFILLITVYGLFRGKSYGRNLSFLASLLPALVFGGVVVRIFAVASRADFSGFAPLFLYVSLFFFLLFLIPFYLSLRPEVGRYCQIYPEEAFSEKSS